MKVLVGGPLLVGGLGPGPPLNPALLHLILLAAVDIAALRRLHPEVIYFHKNLPQKNLNIPTGVGAEPGRKMHFMDI